MNFSKLTFYFLSFSATACFCASGFSQTIIKGNTQPNASLKISELNLNFQADETGAFLVELPNEGKFSLQISAENFETHSEKFSIKKNETKTFNIQLVSKIHTLKEVEIIAKTENQKLREKSVKADIIDIKKVQNQSSSLSEVLNRSVGVKVRQSGGLGSDAQFNINGFNNKAIKVFKDGIPIDYMGLGFNVSLLPLNILDRVEIYKGVMPIYLGADALGGGVNFVTKKNLKKAADISYEIASFNTHRLTLNSFWTNKKDNFFVGLDGFFNHSDNNYKVTAQVLDFQTSTRSEKVVRRFHDAFTNTYVEVFTGIKNRKWADELKFSVATFNIEKENQHGALMSTVYGELMGYQKAIIPSLRYSKSFFSKKLSIDQFLVYSKINTRQVDTCRCTYDWYGNKYPSQSIGESDAGGVLSNIDFKNQVSRTLLGFQINKTNKFEVNNTLANYTRLGSDPYGPVYFSSGKDILSEKAGYSKWVLGFGLTSKFFKNKLENQIAVKHYSYKTNGTNGAFNSYEEGQIVNKNTQWGFAEAFKWSLNSKSFVRFGYELAYRLPEQAEIFGDGMFLLSNFELKPESSKNFNLSYNYTSEKFRIEPNVFYRITRDQINLVAAFPPFSQYQNVEQVKGFGLELDVNYKSTKQFEIFANATYQSLRLFDLKDLTSQFLDGARLRNVPYLFGNIGFTNNFKTIFKKQDGLVIGYFFSYTHNYYLNSIPRSVEPKTIFEKARIDTQLIIPNQAIHSSFLTYTFPSQKLNLNFEVKNIANAMAFDNFRVQRPGRSYHLKISYNLFK